VSVDALSDAWSSWLAPSIALALWLAMPFLAWQQHKRISVRKELLKASERGRGVVEDVRWAGENRFRSRVVYTAPDGTRYRFWTVGEFVLGEAVDIAYDPGNPKRAEVVSNLPIQTRDWGGFVVFVGATAVGLFVALLWLFTEIL
jgi:hypothetical protein